MPFSSFLTQLLRGCRDGQTEKRYRVTCIGVLFTVLSQGIIIPCQIALDKRNIHLPASIIAMSMCAVLLVIANCVLKGRIASIYETSLRGSIDFLGRHMSFGFVASFVMLNRDHISDPLDVPRIMGAFLLSTIPSYLAAFGLASGIFVLERYLFGRLTTSQRPHPNIESNFRISGLSKAPTISTASFIAPATATSPSKLNGLEDTEAQSTRCIAKSRLADFCVCASPSLICVVLLVFVGLPVYLGMGYEAPFEALCFLLMWTCAIQLQRSLKAACGKFVANRDGISSKRSRSAHIAVILANPVLVASLLGTAYLWIKAAGTSTSIDETVTQFRHHGSLAESVQLIISQDGHWQTHLGAGDLLAGPILDAGIVSLGFKMFEHRKELGRSLATVMLTCFCLAGFGVFLGVGVAGPSVIGLKKEEALAFTCRSVTIALGVPAVQDLGGSATLMSALCIFGGMAFQMLGDWVMKICHIDDQKSNTVEMSWNWVEDEGNMSDRFPDKNEKFLSSDNSSHSLPLPAAVYLSQSPSSTVTTPFPSPSSTAITLNAPSTPGPEVVTKTSSSAYVEPADDYKVVAAGVTVGINAAAMGTAHLLERDSAAAAYSALAMTVFGVATVVLTALPGLSEALISLASS